MKVQNNGESFMLTYGGRDLFIPEGISQEFPDSVIHFIMFKADKWGRNVKLVAGKEQELEILKKKLADIEAKIPQSSKPTEPFVENQQENVVMPPPNKPRGRPKKVL
jgi:hypothetical protein